MCTDSVHAVRSSSISWADMTVAPDGCPQQTPGKGEYAVVTGCGCVCRASLRRRFNYKRKLKSRMAFLHAAFFWLFRNTQGTLPAHHAECGYLPGGGIGLI